MTIKKVILSNGAEIELHNLSQLDYESKLDIARALAGNDKASQLNLACDVLEVGTEEAEGQLILYTGLAYEDDGEYTDENGFVHTKQKVVEYSPEAHREVEDDEAPITIKEK